MPRPRCMFRRAFELGVDAHGVVDAGRCDPFPRRVRRFRAKGDEVMLDYRIETFLAVCRTLNYTRAAEELSLTQPAVSQHIAALERACFSAPWTRAQLAGQLPDDRHVFLIAAAGETVLGYANFLHVLDEGDIGNVAVAPEHRRQGIADALLDALCARAAALNLAFLTLEVRASNAPAIALYRKHGFQTVGQRRNYYQKPDEDALLMTWFRREAETI